MGKELEHIQRRLAEEGEKTVHFFRSLEPPDWERKVYTTGPQWRVREVLAHFISAERAYQFYIKDVLEGGDGAPDDMDIDAFNESETPIYFVKTPGDLIDLMQAVRADTLQMTSNLTDEDLSRSARHPLFSEKDLGWYLKLLYRHNLMHLKDVSEALKSQEP